MTESVTEGTRAASPPERVGLEGTIWRIAKALDRMTPGDVAALRRLRPEEPHCPAFWRLAAEELYDTLPPGRVELADAERRWAVILAAMAVAHGLQVQGRRLGAVLAEGLPEARLLRLLRAHGEALGDAVRVTVHHLVSRGMVFDATDVARLVLSDGGLHEEDERRRIYRDYYSATQRRGQDSGR